MKKISLYIFMILTILLTTYFSMSHFVGKKGSLNSFKNLFSQDQKHFVKKYFFPYKTISILEKNYKGLQVKEFKLLNDIIQINPSYLELTFKQTQNNILTNKVESVELSNGYTLLKYKLKQGFYAGIFNNIPGSGYIDFYLNDLIILSSRGILAFSTSINDQLKFEQVKNNINDFIGLKQFEKWLYFSLKGFIIYNEKIFISYTEEIEPDCWNTSVISGEMNYKEIEFKKLFSSKDCIHSSKNIDKDFSAHAAGGEIIILDDNHILLSVGDYKNRYLVQDKTKINGKIIKININNSDYEILSMGHRNPQGLYLDKENNFILETEHGPMGGDEINLIEIDKINKNKIQNYGWPITSAGEHYGGKVKKNKLKYEKYPLYKSHSKYGFIEPLISFVPSIAISKITKIDKDRYVVGSMKDKSLYFFKLNDEKKIIELNRVEVYERVRDMIFRDNKLFLFLEDSPSIGIISIL